MAKNDYYQTLGVNKNASADELKSAYRKQALKYHPDRNQGNKEAEEKFKEVNEAYSVLSDSTKRQRYDQFGHAGVSGNAGGGPGGFGGGGGPQGFDFGNLGDIFGDIFSEAFGGGGGGRRRSNSGRDLRVDQEVTLNQVLDGVESTLVVPKLDSCGTCSGSGAQKGSGMKQCADCKGRGQIRMSQGFFTMSQTCPRCQGYGQVIEKPCHSCTGSGRVQAKKKVRVRIPPGVEDGTTLRIGGAGEAGERGGQPGDLYVVIRVKEHKQFERHGSDLYMEEHISFPKAALGGEITVKALDGDVRLKIPAGTQPGTQFRVSGKGVPNLKSRGRGNLYVQVQVDVPKKLSKEDKKVIQELAKKWGDKGISKEESVFKKVFGG